MIDAHSRRRGRERAVQFLFGLGFTHYAWQEAIDQFWTINPAKPGARAYAMTLIRGVCENMKSLDVEIDQAVDRWSPRRVGHIERAVMRMALYEIRYLDDVPASVAINEAIEVVKRFGAEEAPKFVNGVLDRLAKKVRAETAP